ncbi:MAG: papain-like cysteine protease family protein [Chitinophagaceae bacterium]
MNVKFDKYLAGDKSFRVYNHKVIPRLKQNRQMNCWLYASTMLTSWRLNSKITDTKTMIENWYGNADDSIKGITKDYFKIQSEDEDPSAGGLRFAPSNAGGVAHINADEVRSWFRGCNYASLNLHNLPTSNNWFWLLYYYGPVIFCRVSPTPHVQLLIGLHSDDGIEIINVIVIDPAQGAERTYDFRDFESQYQSATNNIGMEKNRMGIRKILYLLWGFRCALYPSVCFI